MNWDQIKGNWKQLQGKVKEKWGKLRVFSIKTDSFKLLGPCGAF